MSTNVKFLKERIVQIKARLAANPDYLELNVLERIIHEEEHLDTKMNYQLPPKRKYTKSKKSTEAFPNGKMAHVYDRLASIVADNGGRMAIADAKKALKAEHILNRNELKNMVSYIQHCNKRSTVQPRIFLWPNKPKAGNERVIYEEVLTSIPKESASA